jgi:hypothetical protein
VRAYVLVLVALGQNEQETLAYRDRAAALWTCEQGSFHPLECWFALLRHSDPEE